MQQEVSPTIMLMGIGLCLLLVVLILMLDIRRNPSEIRLTVWGAIRRIFQPEPLRIELAFLSVLFSRFGRELLVLGLICGSLVFVYNLVA